jgi:phage N-6-adenine-methyltransferase
MEMSYCDSWVTPRWLYDYFDRRFRFRVDGYASKSNAFCETFCTKEEPFENTNLDIWREMFPDYCAIWLNPPYDKPRLEAATLHVRRLIYQAAYYPMIIAMLCPSKTDQEWYGMADSACTERNNIIGRLRFEGAPGTARESHTVFVFHSQFIGAHLVKSVQKEIE